MKKRPNRLLRLGRKNSVLPPKFTNNSHYLPSPVQNYTVAVITSAARRSLHIGTKLRGHFSVTVICFIPPAEAL